MLSGSEYEKAKKRWKREIAEEKKKPKNPEFIHNGRNYEDAIYKAIRKAKSEAEYPSSSALVGIKQLNGERAVFNLIIEDELKKAKVPKVLIKRLMKP